MKETGERNRTGIVPPEGLRPPQGLNAAMEGLAREVLLKTPTDIFAFAAEYFENLIRMREQFSFDGKPTDIQNLVSANLKNIENTGNFFQNDKNSSTLANNKYKNQKQAKSFDNKSNINVYLKRQNSNLKSKSLENSIFLNNEKHLHDVEDSVKFDKKRSSPKIEDEDDAMISPLKISSELEESNIQDHSKYAQPANEPLNLSSAKEIILPREAIDRVETQSEDSAFALNDVNNLPAVNDESTNLEDSEIHKTNSFIKAESKHVEIETADVSEIIDTQSKDKELDHQESLIIDVDPNEQYGISNTEDQNIVFQKPVVDSSFSLIQEEIKLHGMETDKPGDTQELIDVQNGDSQHEKTLKDSVILNELNDVSNIKNENVQKSVLAREESTPNETSKSLNNGITENLTDSEEILANAEILSNGNTENLSDEVNKSHVNMNNLEESTTLMDDIISINNLKHFSAVEVMHATVEGENNSSSRKKRSISTPESDLNSNIENQTPDKTDTHEESTLAKIDKKEDDGTSGTSTDEKLGEILSGDETNITKEIHTENEISNLISDDTENHLLKSENNEVDIEKLDSDSDVHENNQNDPNKLLENNITDIESRKIHIEEIIQTDDYSIENTSAEARNESLNDETISEKVENSINVAGVDQKTEGDVEINLRTTEDLSGDLPQCLDGHQEDNAMVQKFEHVDEKVEISKKNEYAKDDVSIIENENGDINEKRENNLKSEQDVNSTNAKIISSEDNLSINRNTLLVNEEPVSNGNTNEISQDHYIGLAIDDRNKSEINNEHESEKVEGKDSTDNHNEFTETKNSVSEEEASILIQRNYRGYQVRKNLKTASDDPDNVSKNLSNDTSDDTNIIEEKHEIYIESEPKEDHTNIKMHSSSSEEKASILIQRNYRGYQVRKNLKTASDDTVNVSKNLSNDASDDTNIIEEKQETDNKSELREDDNNKEIQSSVSEEEASTLIQRNYRGYRVRKNLSKIASDEKNDDVSKNFSNEASDDTNKLEEEHEIVIESEPKNDDKNINEIQNPVNEEEASILIQRNYRGYQVRKNLKIASNENTGEISKNLSGSASDDTKLIKEKLEIDIENEKKEDEKNQEIHNSLREDAASILIQRNYRGYQVRKNLKVASDKNTDEISKNLSNDASDVSNKIEEKPKDEDAHFKLQNTVSQEEEEASILIQRNYRGYQARKSLKAASDEISNNLPNDNNEIEEKHEIDIKNEKHGNVKELKNAAGDENHTFEKASLLIQKVFRGFQVRKNLPNHVKKQAEFEDHYANQVVANNEGVKDDSTLLGESNEMTDEEIDVKKRADILMRTLSYQAAMDNKLYTVSEERNSYSTDEESSTFSSAATKIQAGVRGYLTRRYLRNKTGTSSDTTAPSIGEDSRSLDDVGNAGESHVSTDAIMEETSNISIDQIDQADKQIPGINLIEANKESQESLSRPNQNRKRLRREDAIQLHSPYSSGETPNNKPTSKVSEDEESIGDLAQSIITEIESNTYTPVVEIKQTSRSLTATPLIEPLNSEKLDEDASNIKKMKKERTFEITDKSNDEEMKNIQLTDVENMDEKQSETPELNRNFDDYDGITFLTPAPEKLKLEKEIEIKENRDRKALPRYISSDVETLVSKHKTEHIDDVKYKEDEMTANIPRDGNEDKRSNSSESELEVLKQTSEDKISDATELKIKEGKDDLSTIKGILHSGEFHDTIVLPTKVDRKLSIQKDE